MSGAHFLLPQAKQFYDGLEGLPHVSTLKPTDFRERWRNSTPGLKLSDHIDKVLDVAAVGAKSDVRVALRIYQPKGTGPFPLAVYIHGGGFVGGNLDTHAQIAADYCSLLDVVVVAVEYRLAPEHPFPAAVDDCWNAVLWAAKHAGEVKADPKAMFVAGESAGGNLASVMCLLAKQAQQPDLIRAQICVTPFYDCTAMTRPSYVEFQDDAFLNAARIKYYLKHYLGNTGANPRNPLISPIYAEDLSGLPPAFILSAEVDVLRDEAEEFAEKLRMAGVHVKCKRYLGHFHNSMIDTDLFGKVAENCFTEIAEFVHWVLRPAA